MRRGAAAALLLLLAGCSGPTSRATLRDAVETPPSGYTAQDTDPPPGQLCGSSTEKPPALDADLGRSTAAAWRSGDAELRVWAWVAASADEARQTVADVAAHVDACAATLFA